jgi:hypothetical protein
MILFGILGASLFLCIGMVFPNVFFGMFLLAGLFSIPAIIALAKPTQYEPEYTFDQFAHDKARQEIYMRQVKNEEYAGMYGYTGIPARDSRYIPDDLRRAIM